MLAAHEGDDEEETNAVSQRQRRWTCCERLNTRPGLGFYMNQLVGAESAGGVIISPLRPLAELLLAVLFCI